MLKVTDNSHARATVASKGTRVKRLSSGALSIFRLREYQLKGVEYLRKVNGRGALFWEMRLGKTVTTIRFLSQRADARRILVVGPYSALPGWEDELVRENQKVYPLYKSKPEYREDHFLVEGANTSTDSGEGQGWFLINKEAHLYIDILKFKWDAVVLDETWISNPKAKITKYFLSCTRSKYRILLTGTPAPESELQYYCQLTWFNPVAFTCKSFWDFRIRYFRPEGMDWRISLKGRQYLASVLARSCSVLKRTDVGLNKEKIFEKCAVELSKATRSKYHQIELGYYEGEVLKFAGERWVGMRRLCSGEEKQTELVTLIEGELKNEKIIVWCDFVEEVERIADALDCSYIHGGIGPDVRETIRTSFLQKKRFLVAQPQCWKWGTNLTGVDTVIFFSLPQGLMTWQQVQERTVNLTSTQSLLIVSLLATDTVDEDILESLYAKETSQRMLERTRRGIQARCMVDG
jgi:SNF2 family DNA or RNA helicase